MEIKLLQDLQIKISENPKLFEGIEESDILQLENQIDKKFPSAYREFLFLCGRKNLMFEDLIKFDDLIEVNKYFKKELDSLQRKFDDRNGVWTFSWLSDGVDSFDFFYFDDPEMNIFFIDTTSYDEFLDTNIAVVFTEFNGNFQDLINVNIKQFEYDEWKRNWKKR